ncbi:PREDICTED: CASP-like protein 1F1 [Nelumbo nucifera]|nr:PREDICTED: CASP-like protein 1F1 [Nelumbo nucifera]
MVATWLMATSKQSTEFFGIQIRAVYSDSPDFKFFVYANGIACVSSLVSLLTVYVLYRKGSNPSNYFYVFLHDLIIMALVMAASVAASAIGYVGAYGNTHTGWMSICDQVDKFCHRASDSIIFSYLAFFIYLILTVLSANESRQIQV